MDLLHSDPEQACSRIHGLVSDRLRKRGSSRPVKVDLEGSPSAKSAGNSAPSSGDGGLALLRREVKRNSGVYGSYQFAAGPTKRPGGQAFSVDLGGGLWALGQSKAVAVAAARICRVLGRHEDLVRPYIYYWASGSSPRSAADISEKVWDGRLGPHEDAPPEPATKAKTEATK
ncbi:PAS-rich protein [Aspergillus spelaeus tetramycovirus 1]|uniref:PAS-rich protein n=1 Tax=Aspergillus spelaeus tetramycovirus 1 TaxID=2485922 RepID=A0A3G3C4M7_9VIRU|nr:PAS-rich protein [Aspergillus spelaeus tetramycovirus 1]AYP71806.1 PAS-rich protein [Aspergillus spelaeus tetramycovirus 1]